MIKVNIRFFYKNESEDGILKFNEIGEELGIEKGGWGWGLTFFDADNDGLWDLAATNGWSLLRHKKPYFLEIRTEQPSKVYLLIIVMTFLSIH
jgi:hypothetical protein